MVEPDSATEFPANREKYTQMLLDAPMPDEVAVIFCIANGRRLNARVGGLTYEDVVVRPRQSTTPVRKRARRACSGLAIA